MQCNPSIETTEGRRGGKPEGSAYLRMPAEGTASRSGSGLRVRTGGDLVVEAQDGPAYVAVPYWSSMDLDLPSGHVQDPVLRYAARKKAASRGSRGWLLRRAG